MFSVLQPFLINCDAPLYYKFCLITLEILQETGNCGEICFLRLNFA